MINAGVVADQYQSGASGLLLDGIGNVNVAYSWRKINTSYVGDCAIIWNDAGSSSTTIGFDGSGFFDQAAATAWLRGDTGRVGTIFDQSGNGVNLVQSIHGFRPELISAPWGASYRVPYFDATKFMAATLPSAWGNGTNEQTIHAVVEGVGTGIGYIAAVSSDAVGTGSNDGGRLLTTQTVARFQTSNDIAQLSSGMTTVDFTHYLADRDASAMEIYLKNNLSGSTNSILLGPGNPALYNRLSVGSASQSSASSAWDGYFAELVLINEHLSTSEQDDFKASVLADWGI